MGIGFRRRDWRGVSFAIAGLLLASAVSVRAQTVVTCTNTTGPPGAETTATINIASPQQGAVLTDCRTTAEISGTWSTSQPPRNYDFYIVIDNSGSTSGNSGADVNGDGVMGIPEDNILRAEIAAARAFVEALPPARSRVAIITFETAAVVRQPLTADLAAALATLDSMATLLPAGGTRYVAAMDAVEAMVTTLGDPARSQRCDFLSDGVPSESLATTDASATSLANLGVVIDTFALGNIASASLQSMATISGGTFTPLAVPGDIVSALPAMLSGIRDFGYTSGTASGEVVPLNDGTFSVTVPLTPGANHVDLTMSAGDPDVVSVTCAIDFTTGEISIPDAGAAQAACVGANILLDGSATLTNCATTIYRWLDCNGAEACVPSTDPTCLVTCAGCTTYTLETSCAGGSCILTDATSLSCSARPPTPAPSVTQSCRLVTSVTCGAGSASWRWDLDTTADSDGDGDPLHDADRSGCSTTVYLTAPGILHLQVWAANGGCRVSAPLDVNVADTPALVANAGPDQVACSGTMLRLDGSASTTSSGILLYRWLDCRGLEIAPQSTSPTADVMACGTCSYYTLEVTSPDAPSCVTTDRIETPCTIVAQPVPVATVGCGSDVTLGCGSASTSTWFTWDLDALADSDGDGDPTADVEAVGCTVSPTMPPGTHTVACTATRGGCIIRTPLTFDVADNLVLVAEAGPPRAPCRAEPFVLDGSRSFASSGNLEYRWLSCSRAQIRGWSADPTFTTTCSGSCTSYILQVRSAFATACTAEDSVPVTCTWAPTAPAPSFLGACGTQTARVTCGRTSGATTWGWDLDVGTDADGDGDAMDDADLLGCDQDVAMPGPGRRTVVAWSRSGDCVRSRILDFDFWPPATRSLDGGGCVGHTITLTCGTLAPGATAWWDFDAAGDTDGDGDPANDQDFVGCDYTYIGAPWSADVRCWVEDMPGCRRLVAGGTIVVGTGAPPAEVTGLRVDEKLDAGDDAGAWMTWDLGADADLYRVLRGTIDELRWTRAYDHRADTDLGIGACSTLTPAFHAVAERLVPGDFYYLVTAVTDCGGESSTGKAWTPASSPQRPPRIPTASCP